MTTGRLVMATVAYYRRPHAAVALGVAGAVAVLAGALLVGGSVRASLAAITSARLGRTDFVIAAERPFGDTLADRVAPGSDAAPLFISSGTAVHETSGRRARNVHVYGVDRRFFAFHHANAQAPSGSEVLFSADLAEELRAADGDTILASMSRPTDIPLDSLQGRKEDASRTLRLRYRGALGRDSMGEFSLTPTQGPVRAVFVPLATLQRELEQPGDVNTLLVAASPSLATAPSVRSALSSALTADDLGLRVVVEAENSTIVVESRAGLLPDAIAAGVASASQGESLDVTPVLTWLANRMTIRDRFVPYSLVAAVGPDQFGVLAPTALNIDGPIVLNDWAARDLHAAPGDTLELEYFRWTDEGRLVTERAPFRVAGEVPMQGLAADRHLAPEYPGMTSANNVSDWDPPFPIDLRLVRPADEDYWRRFRATPKAFISLADGQRLWRTRHGQLTSLRLRPSAPAADLEGVAARLRAAIPRAVDPAGAGFTTLDVRSQRTDASAGTTDFAMYFASFSIFLVVASLLLVGLFFRLAIEQRLAQLGVLRAMGYSLKAVRGLVLREGLLVAAVGGSLGIVLAMLWAGLMMYGLGTWWVGAVGTTELRLHVDPGALAYGWCAGLAASWLSIAITIRGLGHTSPQALLTGARDVGLSGSSSGAAWIAGGSLAAAGALTMLSIAAVVPPAAGFFGAGTLVLIGGLSGFRWWLGRRRATMTGIIALGLRNASWRPGRSLTAAGLVAAAVFLIVAVEAFRKDAGAVGTSSGTGGFALVAESAVPIVRDPTTPDGREALGLSHGPDDADLHGVDLIAARLRPGDDTSCLNLFQPARPRVVGVPDRLIDSGRFTFAASIATAGPDRQNPWRLLRAPGDDGVVPAIADATSLEYVLHAAVGDVVTIDRDSARPRRLRIVAALRDSMLQGELLVSERQFLSMFPDNAGYRVFLIDVGSASRQRIDQVARVLEDRLEPFGLDAEDAASRLAAYHRVENTYLSTFQALGGLGLLLGTFGLAAVISRNVLERRRELALLGAAGFTGRQLQLLVLAENIALVVAGMGIGSVAALVAILPVFLSRASGPPRLPLTWLAVVLLTSLVSAPWTTRQVRRLRLVEGLRRE